MLKLYHYTSINNLALILKSRSFRFGRLDTVNDPTEGQAKDFPSLSKYIFVSCFTTNKEENLALWNMYTPNMRGVRIEIDTPLFESYKFNEIDNYLVSENECINEKKRYFIIEGKNEPYEIEYTNDEDLLRPSIIVDDGLQVGNLAQYKREIWSFEQEYRYRLGIVPIKRKKDSDFAMRYSSLMEKNIPPPMDGYLVKILESSFRQMKIICGPKIINGDKEIIESLINNYNKTAQLIESSLTGFIR